MLNHEIYMLDFLKKLKTLTSQGLSEKELNWWESNIKKEV